MYCSNCGTEVKDGTAFCPNCGNRLNVSVVAGTAAKCFDRSACIQALTSAGSVLSELEENYTQVENYKKAAEKTKTGASVAGKCIGFGAGYMIAMLLTAVFRFHNALVILAVWVALGIGLSVLLSPVLQKRAAAEAQKYEDMEQQFRNKYMNLYGEVTSILSSYVPQDYWYSIAVSSIVSYLRTGRADSMKEALNLFEEEMHRLRMENMQELILRENQKQTTYAAMTALNTSFMAFSSSFGS